MARGSILSTRVASETTLTIKTGCDLFSDNPFLLHYQAMYIFVKETVFTYLTLLQSFTNYQSPFKSIQRTVSLVSLNEYINLQNSLEIEVRF